MSILTINSLTSPAANLTITNSLSDTASIVNLQSEPSNVITINQGIPGPPGPAGTGIIDIAAGSGIDVNYTSGTYTISSTINLEPSISSLVNNGRLTLQSGSPITYSDLTSSTLYYTPYYGSQIGLYNTGSSTWDVYTFSELSYNLSGMTTGTNYDIFLSHNGTNFVIEKIAWASDSSRASSIQYQDGVLVLSSSLNKRYLGTIRAISSTTTSDTSFRRFVFNAYNQLYKLLSISDSTTHTYSSSTIRPYRNITTVGSTRCEFICGLDSICSILCNSTFATETAASSVGVSIDSTTAFNTAATNTTTMSSGPALILTNQSSDYINVSLGYHYAQLVQSGSSVSTFYNSLSRVSILC